MYAGKRVGLTFNCKKMVPRGGSRTDHAVESAQVADSTTSQKTAEPLNQPNRGTPQLHWGRALLGCLIFEAYLD